MSDEKLIPGQPPRTSKSKTDRAGHRERMRERLLREGADGLTEVQILELLLTYAIPRRNVAMPARELAEQFGGLSGVFRASSSELTRVNGVTAHAASLLRLAGEIVVRCSGQILPPAEMLGHPKEMERYLVSRMRGMKEEYLLLILLSEQGLILGEEILGGGTVNQVVVFPRQVIERALRHNASALLIVHNHLHGPPLPTLRDREEAERLREVLRPFDISLKDSIVVGAGRCFSIFKNSPL